MKKLALIGLFFGLLLVGAIPNGLSASDHRYVSEWGGYSMSNDGEFFRPQYVAIDDDGNIYVTDLSSRVQKFTTDGIFLKSWGSIGPADGQFGSPSGIAVFGDHVYVADKKQHSIDVFDKDGNFVFSWGEYGTEDGQFSQPHGVKINSDGIVFVADTGNHRIQKFTSDGEFLSAFGIFGTSDGKLKTPVQLAFHEDLVYVVDPGNLKIEKYTDQGVFLKSFDQRFGGSHLRALDIVIDSAGDIYLTDALKHRIVKISSEPRTLKTFGYAGNEKNQFIEPTGLAIDEKGYLLIVDSIKNRIVKFETPISKQIEEALTAEQVEKLKELSYTEEPENIESVDQTTETTEEATEPEQQFVHDTTKPILQVPNDLVIESTGSLTQVDIGEAMAMDDNGIKLIINNSPESFSLGTHQIVWTAVDNSGNSAFAIQEIHVVDTISPVISQIQDKTLEASVPIENIVKLEAPSAVDVSGVMSIISDAPEFFPIGETVVTWTATDVAGNESSIEQRVTIVDTTSPSITVPADIEIEATSIDQNIIDLGEATVIDNGEIISITNDAPEFFTVGNTEVIWSVIDSSGNVSSASQVISIIDTTAPSITPIIDITLEAVSVDENIADLIIPSVYDIHDISITDNAPEFFPIGETVVTWTATDVAGNESSIEQRVTIVDTTSPTLTIPDQKTVEATSFQSTLVEIGEAQADDISGISSLTNDAPETFSLGTTLVTWTAVDNYGNTATHDQTITVVDTTAPSIFVPNDIVSEAVDPTLNYIDIGQVSGFDSTGTVSISNDMPIAFPFGSTTITWTAIDDSGNVSIDTQIVTIVDTTVPEILSPSDIVVEATAPSVTDVQLGTAIADDIIGVNTVTNDAPDSFPLGETTVTWTATDSSGNFAIATQIVSVVDTTAPSITAPNAIQVEAVSVDNILDIGNPVYDDLVGIASVTNDAPDSFPLGETTVTWTATDSSGNFAIATQIVSVVDTTAPSITAPNTIQVEATGIEGNLADVGTPTTSDSVEIISVTNDAPDSFPLGETIVRWTATDSSGNFAIAIQKVSVVDTSAPSITAPNAIQVEATGAEGNLVDIGQASGFDFVEIISITNDAPDSFPLGETTITWTATDSSGNFATTTQIVSVVDTTSPTLTIPENIIVDSFTLEKLVEIGEAQADDISGISSLTNDAPETFPLGNTIVTWNVIDQFGNSASLEQTVSVHACGQSISYYNQIMGTTEDDVLMGTNAADLIFAFGGNDMIVGGAGNDCIIGGEGDDIIFGNEGNDHLVGGEGTDIIKGNSGDDKLTGGFDYDILDGGDGFDISYDSVSDIVIKCEEQL